MNCDQIKSLIPDYFSHNLEKNKMAEFEGHLASCSNCSQEVESLNRIWLKLDTLPEEEPSPALRFRFETMLDAYQQGIKQAKQSKKLRETLNNWLEKWLPRQPMVQLATALALLLIGIFVGTRLGIVKKGNGELVQLRQEVQEMRATVALSLLKQSSPVERLQGVNFSNQLQRPDPEILTALLNTLNDDPNVNVRLAAVDALYLFSDRPIVRQGLIESLAKQNSPMVLIEIIDLMVEIREKRSINALRQLIQNEKLNAIVKERAEWGIGQL